MNSINFSFFFFWKLGIFCHIVGKKYTFWDWEHKTTRPGIFANISYHCDLCNVINCGDFERQEHLGDVSGIQRWSSRDVSRCKAIRANPREPPWFTLFTRFALTVTLTCNIYTNIMHCNNKAFVDFNRLEVKWPWTVYWCYVRCEKLVSQC